MEKRRIYTFKGRSQSNSMLFILQKYLCHGFRALIAMIIIPSDSLLSALSYKDNSHRAQSQIQSIEYTNTCSTILRILGPHNRMSMTIPTFRWASIAWSDYESMQTTFQSL